MQNKPIRVLHMVGAMYPGGMENFIMNLYQNMDRSKIQFDFVVHARKENDYSSLIESMGGRIYELPRLTKDPVKSLRMLKELVQKEKYPIVIRHTANALIAPQLKVARKAGAVTVCHSHNETDPKRFLHKLFKQSLYACTSVRLACSQKAGQWMYGNHDFKVIHNAIDIDKFSYSEQKEKRIREEFHLEDCHVYGHIANFIASKNHKFLLEIFREIAKLDPKAKLICLGEGDLRQEIEEKIKELQLQERVILTGIRHDADAFMSAFDVLVFPSLFEGLPLTLIEAQSAGLPIVMSDTITPAVEVTTGLIETVSLQKSPKEWAEIAVKKVGQYNDRSCQKDSITKAGYNIQQLAKWYENFLLGLVK